MLHTFVYPEERLWRWYVLNDNTVMAQGVSKTQKGADNKAQASLVAFEWLLVGTTHDA